MNTNVKIEKRTILKYKLIIETGLHIGGNKESYGIGGVDSPVIKNPFTNEPIIPGSSIKGKMRMLLENVESSTYKASEHHLAVENGFGVGANKTEQSAGSGFTRIIFRDLNLTSESKEKLQKKLGHGFYTEIKAENTIDKMKGKANPRFLERVPAGAEFEGECVIQELTDDKYDFVELIKKGFALLENSYIGGSGSRGYGKIKIEYTAQEVI